MGIKIRRYKIKNEINWRRLNARFYLTHNRVNFNKFILQVDTVIVQICSKYELSFI